MISNPPILRKKLKYRSLQLNFCYPRLWEKSLWRTKSQKEQKGAWDLNMGFLQHQAALPLHVTGILLPCLSTVGSSLFLFPEVSWSNLTS